MIKEQTLVVSLEEFGLSKYEAKAYVTLITHGTMSAGEIAYYAEMPRTKVYPTLLKLEKKKLVILSKSKPIMCTHISPEGAFDQIIAEQINKVNAMNSLVSNLKQVSEASKKSQGSKEKRYFHISTNNVLNQLRQMIDGTKESMSVTLDQWGLGLLSECSEQLASAVRKNLDIKIIIPLMYVGSEAYKKIPSSIKIKTSDVSQNCFVFDQAELLFIDSSNGEAATFPSSEILALNQTKSFNQMWRSALKTDSVADMTKSESQEVYKIIRIIEEYGLNHILALTYISKNKESASILSLLEKNAISFEGKTLDDVIEIIDSALQIMCLGHVHFDTKNKNISITSKLNSGHSLPWVNIIDGYLQSRGYKTRLVYQNNHQKGEKTYIKIHQ